MLDEPQRYYVGTIPTRAHLGMAFVAVDAKRAGPSAWFITSDRSKAFDFGNAVEAARWSRHLRGEHDEEDLVYMLGDEGKRDLPRDAARAEHSNSSGADMPSDESSARAT